MPNLLVKLLHYRTNNHLALRLLFYILLCSVFFTFLATMFQLYTDYHKDRALIEARIDQIQESYVPGLSESVWYFDNELMETQLNGILQLPDIVYLEIQDDVGQTVMTAGKPQSETIIARQFSLQHERKNRDAEIGTLYVVATLKGVYQRLREKVLVILLTQACTIFLLSICILLIFQFFVTRHLVAMARYTRGLDVHKLDTHLTLDRKTSPSSQPDELEQVVMAMNDMQRRIQTDIAKRRRVEESLRESEEKFRSLFDNINVAVALHEIITDGNNKPVDFVFLNANPMYEKLIQLPAADIIGKRGLEVLPNLEPKWIDVYGKIAQTGEPVTIIDHSEYLDKWWEVKAYSPKKNQFAVAMNDITERKRTEEALRENEEKLNTLFGAMTEMVVLQELVCNDQGEAVDYRIIDCNHAFTVSTGIQKEDAVGKLATEVYQAKTAPYLEEYSRVALTGEPYEFTVYYPPMDKYFMISTVPLQKGQFATITTDITAMKQSQDAIFAKNKELENYLFVASHDLRSPLVNIQGFSQRLQKQTNSIKTLLCECPLEPNIQQQIEKITGEGIPKSLDFILTNASKMDTLINGLLKISRTGRAKISIQKINMNSLMEKIIRDLSFQIEEARGKVVIEDLPDCYGDAVLLDQLFSNIIGNALKYRDKERQLIISIAAQARYNKVIYSIRDTGIGIALRHLEKIWDVFYQVDSQSSESGEGIGLSIVKRIVDKHKGKILVESEEGTGSVFSIELPGYEFSE